MVTAHQADVYSKQEWKKAGKKVSGDGQPTEHSVCSAIDKVRFVK
jgi:hypothetical protein